jgi:CTP synthase (UTP-ammonia lyase)
MSVIPRAAGDDQPCPENATAVYRAYNNGFALGKDSNHRYATNRVLLDAMQEDGWIVEGIAFCSPNE